MTKFELKVMMVKQLESCTIKLKKNCEMLLSEIEKTGISGNYSINSDLLKLAIEIYKTSTILGYSNTFNIDIINHKEKK